MLFPKNKEISKEIIVLAVPVIIGNISRVLMSLVDMAMVGRLGVEALAATGMGALLVWTIITFSLGLRTATQTVASRRLGQKKLNQCGTAMHNGMVMALIYGIPVSALGYLYASTIVPFFLTGEAGALCQEYTRITSLSVLFTSIGFIFQGFFTGVEKTEYHMKVTVTSNTINVYLNAGLIYGSENLQRTFSNVYGYDLSWVSQLWGWTQFPEMGVSGAATATVIASFWMVLHYCFYLFKGSIRKAFKVFQFSLDIKMIKKQLRLAVPMGVQEVIITGGWAVFYKIVGMIGVIELAATEIVFQIMHASIMPAIGVGQACATLVSKYMGEKKIVKAEKSIMESVRWSEIIMGSIGLIFIFFPSVIIPVFTKDANIINISIIGLRIIGFLQFFDAIGLTLWFALTGAGNTLFPAVVESTLLWVLALPISYVLGVKMGIGFWAPWSALSMHIILFTVIITWKIKKGDWKEIEV
jgi:putative MATE family efflux protein